MSYKGGCSSCKNGWVETDQIVLCPCCEGNGKMPNGQKCNKCNATGHLIQKTKVACQGCDGPKMDS